MSKSFTIINARLPGYRGLHQLSVGDRATIESIEPYEPNDLEPESDRALDLGGDWLSLGGVDLQINGCLGLAFPDLDPSHLPVLEDICDYLWQQGIDAFLPTIVTTSVKKIQRSLTVIDKFIQRQTSNKKATAKILGAHLEGPFLNPEKRGAHPAEYLLTPSLETVEWVLKDLARTVKIVTLAPELDLSSEVIPYLKDLGITISLGHSQASDREAKQAFSSGASMVTHAFNAMPSLHHRQPGLLGEAIVNPKVYCGLIADGQHVSPIAIEILLRASDWERGVFLVSDALAPIGLADGIYPWDERQIEVKNGTAKLADGTLAGTTLPLLTSAENLVRWGICQVETAIALATEAPRKAIGLPGIGVGETANLLRWHWDEKAETLIWKRLPISA